MLYSDIIQVKAELICTLSYQLNWYLQLPVQSDVANKLVYFEFNVKKNIWQVLVVSKNTNEKEIGKNRLTAVNFSLTNSETKRESALVCFGILTSKDRIISSIHKNIKELQEVCFDTHRKRENV